MRLDMLKDMTSEEIKDRAEWCANMLENLREKLHKANAGEQVHFNGIQDIQAIN